MANKQRPPPDENGGRWSGIPSHEPRATVRPMPDLTARRSVGPTEASPGSSLPPPPPLGGIEAGPAADGGCTLYQGEAAALLLQTWDLMWAAVGFDRAARDDLRDRLARWWCPSVCAKGGER